MLILRMEKYKEKMIIILFFIIGKWKMTSGDAVATHVTYKDDGYTFEYTKIQKINFL